VLSMCIAACSMAAGRVLFSPTVALSGHAGRGLKLTSDAGTLTRTIAQRAPALAISFDGFNQDGNALRKGLQPSMSLHPAAAPVNPFCAFPWSTTATPDWLFDEVAPDLDKAPLKVLLYIVRRTCGFRKLADAISLNQFQHGIVTRDGRHLDKGCGVTNRTNLLRALDDLEARGLIAHQDTTHADGGNATTIYYLLGPGQGGGAVSAPPPVPQDGRGGVPLPHPPRVPSAHPQQTDVPTNRTIERSLPPTPVAPIAEPRTGDEAAQLGGDPAPDDAGAPTTPTPTLPQRRIDADYQALVGPITALVERLGDAAPPWASVSRGYGLMTRAGLALPAFLALLDDAELLMRPSLAHIEKPIAYLFSIVENLMQQGELPQPTRSTTRPRSSPPSPASPAPATPPAPLPQTADEWGAIRAELATDVTSENYARWFGPTHQVHYDDGVLTVAVPDPFHHQWLDRRLRRTIDRCTARVLPGSRVLFVVEASHCSAPQQAADE